MNLVNVILAAGFGTRMKSELPKVMHPLLGRPMVEWAVRSATEVSGRPPVLVVGYGRELVEAHLGERAQYVVQAELLGTGHAVMQVVPALQGKADAVLVFYADMPMLSAQTQRQLADTFAAGVAAGKRPALVAGNSSLAMAVAWREGSNAEVVIGDTPTALSCGSISAAVESAGSSASDCMISRSAIRRALCT